MTRTVLVTGGSGGIGRAIAELAAREGYAVALTYNANPGKAEEVARRIGAAGGRAVTLGADLSREDEIEALFSRVDTALGRLDVLVNNAGIIGWEGRVDEASGERLAHLWATNLTSCFLCAREAVRRMSTRHGGSGGAIVNVSSLSARTGGRDRRVHYAASKGAMNSFTLGLAKEVATEGVRVNAVVPAFTDTGIHDGYDREARTERIARTIPMQRVAAPEEVAEAVLWLMSERASFVTGALLDVTGGS
jgi:NAD(P)-dependent dehydrogenase (short-subunit alcohol dehydrogenase family)